MHTKAFQNVVPNSTVNVAIGTSTANVKICDGGGMRQVRIVNDSTQTVFIAFGGSTVATALTTGFPMRAGSDYIFSAAPENGVLYAAVIGTSASGKVYFTWGDGF